MPWKIFSSASYLVVQSYTAYIRAKIFMKSHFYFLPVHSEFLEFFMPSKIKVIRNWMTFLNDVRIHMPLKYMFQLIVQAWVVDMCSFRNASHASYLLATSSRYLRRYRVSRTWEMLSNEAAKMINQLTPDITSNDFWKNVVSF